MLDAYNTWFDVAVVLLLLVGGCAAMLVYLAKAVRWVWRRVRSKHQRPIQ